MTHKPTVAATYAGYQMGYQGLPGFDLWLLQEDIPGHCKGSSVSTNTIRAEGWAVPNRRVAP